MQLDKAKELLVELRYQMLRKKAESEVLKEEHDRIDTSNELEVSLSAKKSFEFDINAKILGVKISALEDHILQETRYAFMRELEPETCKKSEAA
jgi:hypothetical protein